MRIVVELYGVARSKAGIERIPVEGETIGAALAALERACPALVGAVIEGGRLSEHYRLSLNGRCFVSDPARRLTDGDRLLLLSAEAGG